MSQITKSKLPLTLQLKYTLETTQAIMKHISENPTTIKTDQLYKTYYLYTLGHISQQIEDIKLKILLTHSKNE